MRLLRARSRSLPFFGLSLVWLGVCLPSRNRFSPGILLTISGHLFPPFSSIVISRFFILITKTRFLASRHALRSTFHEEKSWKIEFPQNVPNMLKTCPDHVLNVSWPCLDHFQNMSWTCSQHVWNVSWLCWIVLHYCTNLLYCNVL